VSDQLIEWRLPARVPLKATLRLYARADAALPSGQILENFIAITAGDGTSKLLTGMTMIR